MQGTYVPGLVLLSVIVAVLASYTALDLARRVTGGNSHKKSAIWLTGGACSMGTGIWAMHFIGMLAYELPVAMGYDLGLTLASMLIAVLVSGFALWTASRERLSQSRLLLGGTLMGLGIAAMHYCGMYAMRMSPAIEYDPLLFSLSVAVAAAASMVALWLAFSLRTGRSITAMALRAAAALVMGGAVAGMHYIGMAAAEFAPGSVFLSASDLDNQWLAVCIGLVAFGILAVTLVPSVLDTRLVERTATLARSLRRANEELRQLALHDHLTRLPNRLLLEDRIGQAIAQARRASTGFALLFVDLDRLKTINDSLGHHVGDELLRRVGTRLQETLRAEDTVARVGGDEFVLLLPGLVLQRDVEAAAQRVLDQLNPVFAIEGHELRTTASVGVSLFPDDGESAHELMINADAAMYQVKQTGRNAVRFYHPGMNTLVQDRLALQNDLREALENDALQLHYQPRIDVRTDVMTGVEALARWQHPQRGTVPPSEFIPAAEDSGLILPLGAWVLRTACRQARVWLDAGLPPMRMAVNLSGAQFRQKDLVEVIADALAEADLPPQSLELEVTESVIMQNVEEAARTLQRLRATGVHIAVDDFGTGYSSLAHLKRFPIGTLKIDRSFVRDLASDAHDAAIVRAVVALGHSLGMSVVAEGVETVQQLAFLRALRTDEYQGFLCSAPLPAERLARLCRERIDADSLELGDQRAALSAG